MAEAYLKKHRGIKHPERMEFRFWPKGANWINYSDEGKLEQKVNKIPAVIVAAKNSKQEITAVQRIYLDEATGGKNKFMDKPKLSKGVIEGSAALIQKGMKGAPVYIAEGPETAASIAEACPTVTVLAALGISNIKNLAPVLHQHIKSSEVIIAADYDGEKSKTSILTEKAAAILHEAGFKTQIVLPQPIEGLKKTDWNDILLKRDVSEVKMQLLNLDLKNSFGQLSLQNLSTLSKETVSFQPKEDKINSSQIVKNQRIKEMNLEI